MGEGAAPPVREAAPERLLTCSADVDQPVALYAADMYFLEVREGRPHEHGREVGAGVG